MAAAVVVADTLHCPEDMLFNTLYKKSVIHIRRAVKRIRAMVASALYLPLVVVVVVAAAAAAAAVDMHILMLELRAVSLLENEPNIERRHL